MNVSKTNAELADGLIARLSDLKIRVKDVQFHLLRAVLTGQQIMIVMDSPKLVFFCPATKLPLDELFGL